MYVTKAASLMMIVLLSLERLVQKNIGKGERDGVNQGLTIACILQQSGPAQRLTREWAVDFGLFRRRGQDRIDTRTLQGLALR